MGLWKGQLIAFTHVCTESMQARVVSSLGPELMTHPLLAGLVLQPGIWRQGQDSKKSGMLLLGIGLAQTENCIDPRMIIEGSLIHGSNKGLRARWS